MIGCLWLTARFALPVKCLMFWLLFLGPAQNLAGLPADVKSLLEQARAYEKANDYRNAERTYRQALTLAPADPEIYKRLGVLYQTELKFAESIDLFRRALSLSSQYPKQHDGKSGYLSQSALPLYFGLDESKKIDHLEVQWPSGKKQVVSPLPRKNQTIQITEAK